jgi:hypothetical protein
MRTKRFLLVTAALATAACGKDPATPDSGETLPLPANPKGSFYDANANIAPPPIADAEAAATDGEAPKDAGATKTPPPPHDAGAGAIIKPHPLPANPKGSFYDGGKKKVDHGY